MTATYNADHIYNSSTITYDGALAAIIGAGSGPRSARANRAQPSPSASHAKPGARVRRPRPEAR